jgi:hypothetical protein
MAAEAVHTDHNRPHCPADLLDDEFVQNDRLDVRDQTDVDLTLALQNAKIDTYASSASASFAFAPTAELGLIDIDFAAQPALDVLGVAHDSKIAICIKVTVTFTLR